MNCRDNSWYFFENFAMTFDERDTTGVPVKKPFPAHNTRYKEIIDRFDMRIETREYRLIAIPKSRQHMASWLVMLYFLNKAMTRPMSALYIQSEHEKKALKQILRVNKAYTYLHPDLQAASPLSKPADKQPVSGLYFKNGSLIEALPQGGDAIRSVTATALLSDEAAFQKDFAEVMKAAKANTGLHIVVSTPNPGTFQKIVEDTYGDE